MQPARIVVFLPCHTLDDFPPWLEEHEADDVLAAWTAVWEPRLLAAVGRAPEWASVDLRPPDDEPILGVVPAALDQRFAAQADAICSAGSRWVRDVRGAAAVAAAVAQAAGSEPAAGAVPLADDFRALGMAVLLVEVLARRMRSTAGLETTEFAATVVAAARAAVAGHDDEARERLRECFGFLSATRSRYYSVDVWLVDLVLLADTTLGRPLIAELTAPTPLGIVATGQLVERLAAEHPASLARLRERCAAGTASACGGRDADELLALATPEQVLASFERGRAAWERHVGCVPRTFARVAGGGSAVLPAVLAGFGYAGAVWPLFDGTPLPDPGDSRIRWAGAGEACIDGVARPPIDVRSARAILALPEALSNAMDHDHVAVVTCARYAGTASPWHAVLQRIGSWTDALGTFVTPDELFQRTAGRGTRVDFEADAFPVPAPADAGDPLAGPVADAAAEARRIVTAAAGLRPLLPPGGAAAAASAGVRPAAARPAGRWPWSRNSDRAELVLDNGQIRLQAHPRTGGLLSLRRPADRGNRLSQQLAPRTTRPAATVGAVWDSVEDRAEHGRMQADAVARVKTAAGDDCIESRGRLLAADGRGLGGFVQRMTLVPGLPLAVFDLEVRLDHPLSGPLFEAHVACRFAWHENEDVEILRSLHTQAVVTERTRFTAPHFIALRGSGRGADTDDVAILTGGLPWHIRSSSHVLDTILLGGGATTATRRIAVGIGLERPWDEALHLLAAAAPAAMATPATVRLAPVAIGPDEAGGLRAVVDLIEAAGRAGPVRVEWAREPRAARGCDFAGRPRDDVTVAIEGRSTVVSLRRHEWLRLHLEFPA
jgi:hypothetical protein